MSGCGNFYSMEQARIEHIIDHISQRFESFSPQLRKAARYVMDNPQDVPISSVRVLADAADVKPNSFVRLAHELGYDGYDEFRELFRNQLRKGSADFPDRVRWLQTIRQTGDMGQLYANMVNDAISNLEQSFAGIDEASMRAAAETIWQARHVYVMGVGVNYTNAANFAYLASTGMNDFTAIPRPASTAIDDLSRATDDDVLIAITMSPYRKEVLETARFAKERGMKLVSLSDSFASPVITQADHPFIIHIDTSQFFPSSVAIIAVLETLLSFVVAVASDEIADRVESFHQHRHELGLYYED